MNENSANDQVRTKIQNHWPWILGMLATGFVGLGLGAAAGGDGDSSAPAECLDAVDEGERLARGLEFTLDWTSEFLTAAGNLDTVRMEELTAEMTAEGNSGEYDGALPDFRAAARACESA